MPRVHASSTEPLRKARTASKVEPTGRRCVTDVKAGLVGLTELRIIAVWEAVKGALVLMAAAIALKFLRLDADHTIDVIVDHLHLDPAGHTSRMLNQAAEHLTDTRLMLIAVGAIVYALIRFFEAYGLWFQKRWGWLLGIASAALYLPIEIVDIVRHPSRTNVALFAINVLIIGLLWRNRTRHRPAVDGSSPRHRKDA